jgi:DNA (cytosine-5)-methyltransferase 1
MANADSAGFQERERIGRVQREKMGSPARQAAERRGDTRSVVNAAGEQVGLPRRARQPGETHWSGAEWIDCTDGKARPVRPGSSVLAHGVRSRASKLRAYGNAIVPQVAAEFIRASAALISY